MSKEILEDIIKNFSPDSFEKFFRSKSNKFRFPKEPLSYGDNNFQNAQKIAEVNLEDGELSVWAFLFTQHLSERSGKKAQYELGKKILKETQSDAGIFIFYDINGNFRFSLIYTEYFGTKRKFSYFRRFTFYVNQTLTNKTFIQQVSECNFSSLNEIKQAFSVEPVTKQFYEEIKNWYFWAMDKIKFPCDYKYSDDAKEDREIHNATNLIRLITRILFIWFLKEKEPALKTLFDREKLKDIVKDFAKPGGFNYYNAILQNLFFATLNSKIKERGWAEDKGYPENKNNYGVKILYRYEDKFCISKDEVLKLFKDIPFLNGGLFDCLDKEDENGKVIYIDGFSRNPKKQAVVPDYLFFQSEGEKVDLSKYGLGSNKSIRGLIEILKNYNFTIDENTPVDQEIALDPELLGKVFENLLACYNPETSTTARKATGSYYTPREIVDYMAEESLFVYLKTKFHKIDEEKLRLLLSYSEDAPDFSESERQKLISNIASIKMLDPACGSGAFPMGILHKLVHVLKKLDPENKLWYELQYQKALKALEEAFKEKDKFQREEMLREINEVFDESVTYPDYARKLYLIENCIYGVDIQPIAVQITKLRFFITLLLDQKVDRKKENFGIRALPNLETKFVAANTLIGLEIPHEDLLLQDNKIKQIQDKLAEHQHKYFNAKTRNEKSNCQRQYKKLREKLAQEVVKFLIEQKKNEINQIKQTIENEKLKLQKVIQEPEDIKISEQLNLFGEIVQIKIDRRKERIKAIKWNIKEQEKKLRSIQKQIEGDSVIRIARKIASFDLFDQNASSDWFDPEWMFGVKDGFDIVIGNPPKIPHQKTPDEKRKYADLNKNCGYQTFDRTGDIYCLFYERGLKLLKDNGILTYISSNKWMRAGYGEILRDFFTRYNPKILIDLGPGIFESATVDTNILLIQKSPPSKTFQLKAVTLEKENNQDINISQQLGKKGVVLKNLSKDAWFIGSSKEQQLKEKIEAIGKPLKEWDVNIYRGILTGLNEAFIITTEKRNEILANCKDEDERRRTEAIIKPILRGRDIKRYYYEWQGLWVIGTFPALRLNIDDYPALKKYFLDNFDMRQLEQSGKKYPKLGFGARKKTGNKWFETQDQIAYYSEFEKEKVVWQRITQGPTFCLVEPNVFILDSMAFFTGNKLKYIIAILNSKLIYEYVSMIVHQYGFTGFRLSNQYVEIMPLPPITSANQSIVQQIEALVDRILSAKKQNPKEDTRDYERQIDQMVYQLYGLTEDEIRIVEGQEQ